MRAGILQYKIECYKLVKEKDKYGAVKEQYVFAFKTRANIKVDSGTRDTENSETVYNLNLTLICRYYCKFEDTFRIKFEGKDYRIISILPDKPKNQKVLKIERINT